MYLSAVIANEQGIGVYRGQPAQIPRGRVLIASWLDHNNGERSDFMAFTEERGLNSESFDVGSISIGDIINKKERSGIRCYIAFDKALKWNPKAHPASDIRPASELLYPIDQKIVIAGIEYDIMLQFGLMGQSGSVHYHFKGLERYFGLDGIALQVAGNELVAISQNRTQRFDIKDGHPVFKDTGILVPLGTKLNLTKSREPYPIVDDPVHNITVPNIMLDECLPAFSVICLLIDDISVGHTPASLDVEAAEMIFPNGQHLFDYSDIQIINPGT